MTSVTPARTEPTTGVPSLPAAQAAALDADDVLARLGSRSAGLSAVEAARRLSIAGANAVRSYRVRALPVLVRQLRSPLLVLLAVTAIASAFIGEGTNAVIIGIILAASVGLGFVNEYRAEKTAEALHSTIHHSCLVVRDGHPRTVDVTGLVPGDVVTVQLGEVVPADLRLLATTELECDESVLTGESVPAEKSPVPVAAGTALAELTSCALMGTVVRGGSGVGVVVSTGAETEFGRIAVGLGERPPETEFQVGLRKFSALLVQVAAVLTDKTGTLTEGTLRFERAIGPDGNDDTDVLLLGLLCTEAVVEDGHAVGGNPSMSPCGRPRPPPGQPRRWPATGGPPPCRSTTNAAPSPSSSRTTPANE
jgi:P-type Mg2+ transporter